MYKIEYLTKEGAYAYELFNNLEQATDVYREYKSSGKYVNVILSVILDEYNFYDKFLD